MTEDSDLRRRTVMKQGDGLAMKDDEKKSKSSSSTADSSSGTGFGILDGLRIVTALTLVSLVASYFVTRGESFIWNARRPWWTKPKLIKAAMVSQVFPSRSIPSRSELSFPNATNLETNPLPHQRRARRLRRLQS